MTGGAPRPVLLVPTQEAALRSLVTVGRALAADCRFEPVLVLAGRLGASTEVPEGMRALRIDVEQPAHPADRPPRGGALAARVDNVVRWSPPVVRRRIEHEVASLGRLREGMAAVFDRFEPVAVLVSDDRLGGWSGMLLAEAAARAVPRIVVPYALSRPVGPAKLRFPRRSHRVDSRPLQSMKTALAATHPGQVFEHDGVRLLFHDVVRTEALLQSEALGLRPWAVGGGLSDLLCVAADDDRAHALEMGLDEGRVRCIGDVALDELFAATARRDATRARLGAADDDVVVVLAVPQLGEQGVLPWDEHMRAMDGLLSGAAARGGRVVLSLHPKSRPGDYQELASTHGAMLAAEPLVSLLPAADVFVAGFSSTVRWAVLCRVPTVVVDLGWWGYDLFDGVPGVVTVRDREAYETELADLVGDAELRAGRAAACRVSAQFDGRACERLIAIVAAATS